VAFIDAAKRLRTRVVETKVAFRRLESNEIAEYVQKREGLGKAGGYAIQGHAAVFARTINGSYSNVVGLPLTETFHLLKACGVV
jgi:septum formation protein